MGKLYESRLPILSGELLRVPCCEEHAPAPVMARYLNAFKEGMGAVQQASFDAPDGPIGVSGRTECEPDELAAGCFCDVS